MLPPKISMIATCLFLDHISFWEFNIFLKKITLSCYINRSLKLNEFFSEVNFILQIKFGNFIYKYNRKTCNFFSKISRNFTIKYKIRKASETLFQLDRIPHGPSLFSFLHFSIKCKLCTRKQQLQTP